MDSTKKNRFENEQLLTKLKLIQAKLSREGLSFIDRMELKDEELSLKKQLGLITPPEDGEDCISCSG